MSEVFHPLEPSPAKIRVDLGTVYVVSVRVSVTCSVVTIVKKTVEKLVLAAGASSPAKVRIDVGAV